MEISVVSKAHLDVKAIKQFWLCWGKSFIGVCFIWFHEMQIGNDGHERRILISFPFWGALVAHICIWMLLCLSVCARVSLLKMHWCLKLCHLVKSSEHSENAAGTFTNHKLTAWKRATHHPVSPPKKGVFAWITTSVWNISNTSELERDLDEKQRGPQTPRHFIWASGL